MAKAVASSPPPGELRATRVGSHGSPKTRAVDQNQGVHAFWVGERQVQGGKAAEGVGHHHSTLNSHRVEKRADELCGEGRCVIGGLAATVVAGKVYRLYEVLARQGRQHLGPLTRAGTHPVQ